MREIKLRAWNTESNRWHSVDGLTFENGKLVYPEWIKIMQFCGLQDKNGKEIWEGDILRMKGKIAYEVEYCKIPGFHEGSIGIGFHLVRRTNESDNLSYYDFPEDGGEVLGNIYENPELLKTP